MERTGCGDLSLRVSSLETSIRLSSDQRPPELSQIISLHNIAPTRSAQFRIDSNVSVHSIIKVTTKIFPVGPKFPVARGL